MYQIAIIGAGQLGSRHLQALARLTTECEITVIDPSLESLAVAKQRFEEMPVNKAVCVVGYGTSVDELPVELDYVVVATGADVRLKVLQSLLARSTVRYMLLEKVLFQRLGDYEVTNQQGQGKYWRSLNESLHQKTDTIIAERGTIFSEDGKMLSTSIPEFDVYIDFAAAKV